MQPSLFDPLASLTQAVFETPAVLRKLTTATRKLAELKGMTASVPNVAGLMNVFAALEARDSSAIENIYVTHDELFRSIADDNGTTENASAVLNCFRAQRVGMGPVQRTGLLTENTTVAIQATLDPNRQGYRKLPGTAIRDGAGRMVHNPPQSHAEIVALMTDLERFINDDAMFDADPLIKMAIMHHQFESIHPFYDGNGRTGRIMNSLYLVNQSLLEFPVISMSSYILEHRREYYRLLQAVRASDNTASAWQEWVIYMLSAVESAAEQAIGIVNEMNTARLEYKHGIRNEFKFYSRALVENLFANVYTKIDLVERDVGVSRLTATKYLEELAEAELVHKVKVGRTNYFINRALEEILTRDSR